MLVELPAVKAHLRLTYDDADPAYADLVLDLAGKHAAAEAAVLRWVGKSAHGLSVIADWTDPAAVPFDAQAAVLIVIGELWRFRGDDPGAAIYTSGRDPGNDLAPVVIGLLRRFTDPVLA